ncbi:MAG: PLP-dependent aspartate aminotransferase family protein [Spirochaetaceae bacterium]|jgi:cystathionine gamma-synthase|nr:PLP-dependent aspartate aminotransferase family protein [Spirochaetaceae bacterium]
MNVVEEAGAGDCYPGDRRYGFDTLAVHGAELFEPVTGAVSVPIYQSSTFRHPGLNRSTGFDYSRTANPTRRALERAVALLEGGPYGLAFATGMGAISALMKVFEPGAHFIVSEDLYGGTYRLLDGYYRRYGYRFSWVDTSDPARMEAALLPETRALFIETPSNPMMKVTDIARAAELIHRRGGLLIVDNTFLSPYYQKPLSLGADIVVHSATKYLAGHNDTLAGLIVHKRDDLEEDLQTALKSEGATLGPFDAWLALRGLKTLAIRMKRQSESAARIARWLRSHPQVEKVFYPGFEDHPQYALSQAQTSGSGGMISFYLRDPAHAPALLSGVSLILFAESLGGVESLLTYPLTQTHQAIPEAMRRAAGVDERLMRLSVGIEDPEDLIADLDQALARCVRGG